ncbi:hypothetical protein MLD38_016446 [Melastoma candidum]|uniref:Uncharacterized protein n=1 Tax=Melastoma candidum TaxID=119954 RepID=A0ACB9RJK7_9MYRT|nr:hypothetical protein MLD38_016446 [Melastoma candidum]
MAGFDRDLPPRSFADTVQSSRPEVRRVEVAFGSVDVIEDPAHDEVVGDPSLALVLYEGQRDMDALISGEDDINGENKHYGTPTNPCAEDCAPGGSSSGSAVAVGAKLADFSLGTDTGGSVRVPASYCGIFGFRPSHNLVTTAGVIPMAQSFDTVGELINTNDDNFNIPSLAALSSAMRLLQSYEFKKNHGEWVSAVKPELGPGIAERVHAAVQTTNEKISICLSVKKEFTAALTTLLGENGILAIPTVPGPPPKLLTDPSSLEIFRARAFSLLSIAGVSGFCQVILASFSPIELCDHSSGLHEGFPFSFSLVAKHGSDRFLLDIVEILHSVRSQALVGSRTSTAEPT